MRSLAGREQQAGQDSELTVKASPVSRVALRHLLLQFGVTALDLLELLDQPIQVQRVSELVEFSESHVRHQIDELPRISQRDGRLAELERAHHVVVARSHDYPAGCHLLNKFRIGRGGFGGDARRLQIGPVTAQVSLDLLGHVAVELIVPAEQPDPVTAIDQPPGEACHRLDVGGMNLIRLLTVIVSSVVSHHANPDELRVTRVIWRRRDAEDEVRINLVPGCVNTSLPRRVP